MLKKILLIAIVLFFLEPLQVSANSTCITPLKLQVSNSLSKTPFSTQTLITQGLGRYYIKVLDKDGKPCSTKFNVKVKQCPLSNTNCNYDFNVVNYWSQEIPGSSTRRPYMSGEDGIARIDFPKDLGEGLYQFSVMPFSEESSEWSNLVTVVNAGGNLPSLKNQGVVEDIDLTEYYNIYPGNTYILETINYKFGRENPEKGITYLIHEESRLWGDFITTPWRFTKNSPYAYWRPKTPNSGNPYENGQYNLRWMVASPDERLLWDDYIWGIGDKRYRVDGAMSFERLGVFENGYFYRTSDINYPAYNLGPKYVTLPYLTSYSGTTNYLAFNSELSVNPNKNSIITSPSSRKGDWRIRIERDTWAGYDDVVRVDFYEGDFPLEIEKSHKETWYLAKGVGFIGGRQLNLNNIDPNEYVLSCLETPDCFNVTSNKTAAEEYLIKDFFPGNSRLDVRTITYNSEGVVGGGDSVTINPFVGEYYSIVINNIPYEGFLESRLRVGGTWSKPEKWLWAKNGVAVVSNDLLKEIDSGTYDAQFRIWAPDILYENETSYEDLKARNIPWSNTISVKIDKSEKKSFDTNLDGRVDIVDALVVLSYLFR